MQAERAIDFDYLPSLGLGNPPCGAGRFNLNDFVGTKWVKPELDELWCKNYLINKQKGVPRFEKSWIGSKKIAVFVGASPAVLKQIETLKKLDDNFIIIACNTVYGELVKSGVKVKYVFAVEAHEHIAKDFTIQDESTEIIASPFICPAVLDMWRGKKWIYAIGGGKKYQQLLEEDKTEDIDIGGGNTISTAACWAYKYLACRDFILIGTSFCYYDKYYFDNRTTEHVCDFEHESKNIKAVDIYGNLVNVTPGQLSYKVWLENFIREAKDASFINSTEDGILGVVPEILNFDGENGQYTIKYLPWINIIPFTLAVEAYGKKLKEIK